MSRGIDVFSILGKRNDEEGAKEKLYTYASHVIVESFKVRLGRVTLLPKVLTIVTGSRDNSR